MDLSIFWTGADVGYNIILALTILIMLLAMSRMSRYIRILQYQTSVIEDDLKLMGEEIKMLGSRGRAPTRPRAVEED